jgi:hypothetical protein
MFTFARVFSCLTAHAIEPFAVAELPDLTGTLAALKSNPDPFTLNNNARSADSEL